MLHSDTRSKVTDILEAVEKGKIIRASGYNPHLDGILYNFFRKIAEWVFCFLSTLGYNVAMSFNNRAFSSGEVMQTWGIQRNDGDNRPVPRGEIDYVEGF